MGPNPFIGVIYHWLGGFSSATNFIPFRGIKRWSWEIYWLIQGVAAWLIAPVVLASLFVPHLWSILATVHADPQSHAISYAVLFGALWGTGSVTFGLSSRYLGISLGYAIALGLCTVFGTLIPPIYDGSIRTIVHETSGQIILLGVAVCLIAVVINGAAGYSKEKEFTAEEKAISGERDFAFGKGVLVASFAGVMSSFFAFGLQAGKPIGDLTKAQLLGSNHSDLWQNLPILIVVLWGGFFTNFLWSAILIVQNKSSKQFVGAPGFNPMGATTDSTTDTSPIPFATLLGNYFFAGLAGVIWYFQFFFYSMGQTKMGKYDFSSWTLHMASIIIFATLWGIALKEWRGTSRRTRILLATGLILLVGSTVIVGYGNYRKVRETTRITMETFPAHLSLRRML